MTIDDGLTEDGQPPLLTEDVRLTITRTAGSLSSFTVPLKVTFVVAVGFEWTVIAEGAIETVTVIGTAAEAPEAESTRNPRATKAIIARIELI
jgi:hypothetical protein